LETKGTSKEGKCVLSNRKDTLLLEKKDTLQHIVRVFTIRFQGV